VNRNALACLFLAPLLLAACRSRGAADSDAGGSAAAVPIDVEFSTLAQGATSGLTRPESRVIRNAQAWQQLWKRHAAEIEPAPALPEVDFAAEMVIVVALGDRPSAGWSVEIERLVDEGGFLRLEARELEPEGPAATMITQPYHMVRTRLTDAPVELSLR
jgi:hypothetical protein